MSIRQFIADVMELPKAINAVNKTIGGEARSHTPWQLQRTPYESEIDIVSDGRVIATVEAGDGQEKVAQILVAAPDMLEALETIMDIGDKACRDIARAAIRKARDDE
jgi:hypothetical protein